jgi:hypothetical protein
MQVFGDQKMAVVDELFQEYVIMRRKGLIKTEVLTALSHYYRMMSKVHQQGFVDTVQAWEQNQTNPKQTLGRQPVTDSPPAAGAADEPVTTDGADWIACTNCGKRNRINSVFCYDCGYALDFRHSIDTQRFTDKLGTSVEYFGEDSLLVLKTEVNNTEHEYEVKPQAFRKGVVIGRSAIRSAITPDIDLREIEAIHAGVSRLHLTIRYDESDNVLKVYDLGSTNGTFINARKLHPREVRVLRNGDDIKLGRLIMNSVFFHPGDEI